jgi:hypothetical protein
MIRLRPGVEPPYTHTHTHTPQTAHTPTHHTHCNPLMDAIHTPAKHTPFHTHLITSLFDKETVFLEHRALETLKGIVSR